VNKNGELLAKLEQKVSSKSGHHPGGQPDTKVQLTVDIPSKGIHKHTSYTESPRKRESKFREYDKKSYVRIFIILHNLFYFGTQHTICHYATDRNVYSVMFYPL